MPHYTEKQQARLMALPGAILLLVLTMCMSEPKTRLRDVIEDMDFVQEVKQAYPDNTLIQGIFEPLGVDTESTEFRAFLVGLVKKLAEDVEKGLFGNDPVMVKMQSDYLRTLEIQFSLVPSHLIDNTLL